jgi:hypothetical protein
MTLLEREREALAAAPSHDELVLRLRAVMKEAMAAFTPPDDVLAALAALRTQDPEHEDVVLDVMDFLMGWSSPHVTLDGLKTSMESASE